MAQLIDLFTGALLDPDAAAAVPDEFERSRTVADRLELTSELLWAQAAALVRRRLPGRREGPGRAAAERHLLEHWDEHVREAAELARRTAALAHDLHAAVDEADIPF